jgi:hypothetical protein
MGQTWRSWVTSELGGPLGFAVGVRAPNASTDGAQLTRAQLTAGAGFADRTARTLCCCVILLRIWWCRRGRRRCGRRAAPARRGGSLIIGGGSTAWRRGGRASCRRYGSELHREISVSSILIVDLCRYRYRKPEVNLSQSRINSDCGAMCIVGSQGWVRGWADQRHRPACCNHDPLNMTIGYTLDYRDGWCQRGARNGSRSTDKHAFALN